jgi:hypothetical protein
MFQVSTYRGVAAGWLPVGKPRSADSAAQLLTLLNRVRPDYSNRQTATN